MGQSFNWRCTTRCEAKNYVHDDAFLSRQRAVIAFEFDGRSENFIEKIILKCKVSPSVFKTQISLRSDIWVLNFKLI